MAGGAFFFIVGAVAVAGAVVVLIIGAVAVAGQWRWASMGDYRDALAAVNLICHL